jgi:cell division GTPase FtsZ
MKETHIIIGLGGAGASVAKSLVARLKKEKVSNAELYLFNTSRQDMKGLKSDEYYLLGDTEGCGKDREKGKKIAISEEENILKFFETLKDRESKKILIDNEETSENIASINLVFSNGGGTGSGISIMFTKLAKKVFGKDTPIFVNIITPLSFETIPTINSMNHMLEYAGAMDRKEIVYNIFDNNIISEMVKSTDFELINGKIVDAMLLLYYEYLENNSSPASSFNLDRNDFYRIVSQKGNTAGLINVYGWKKGKFETIHNYIGMGDITFEGARKVLIVVKHSKFINKVMDDVKKAGTVTVSEFKALDFKAKITNNLTYDALIFAIGEPKNDSIIEDISEKFMEAVSVNEKMKEKDVVKESTKKNGVKKVNVKF